MGFTLGGLDRVCRGVTFEQRLSRVRCWLGSEGSGEQVWGSCVLGDRDQGQARGAVVVWSSCCSNLPWLRWDGGQPGLGVV